MTHWVVSIETMTIQTDPFSMLAGMAKVSDSREGV